MSELKVGVLVLGGFVGFLLGLGLFRSKNVTLKGVITIVGAALGGAPVLFMNGVGRDKWMYPIGLVIGLVWNRMFEARSASQR
jgi:hypothetical protein